MRHARNANELFEVPHQELWPVVGDDPRPGFRVLLPRRLQDDLDVALGHRRPPIPVHDDPAEAFQHRARIIERARSVDIGHVNVPMLVRPRRWREAGPFFDGFPFHLCSSPPWPSSTRHTLEGLTATTSASSIMNVNRR